MVCVELHHEMMRGRGADPLAPVRTLREYGYRRFERGGRAFAPEAAVGEDITRLIAYKD